MTELKFSLDSFRQPDLPELNQYLGLCSSYKRKRMHCLPNVSRLLYCRCKREMALFIH